ncbi:FMN-binding negative transcriptional regulator [Sphingomonas sp. ERG5]|uniref:FMN-binding negative transcriptional regulator n=1 Tax=Sphingomonas sp. ERG5 TaxID=1381597 RepID=UPI001F157EB3|nr:FMN-binding negative transcriptional regulator [Sphingomonas sp. ERG5]
MTGKFSPKSPADVTDFVRAQMLGLVVSDGPGGYAMTPLPFLPQVGPAGEVVEFFGHFARANPQVAMVRDRPRALILFQGPHAYVPPAWVSTPGWAPTWNYAVAQFEVDIRLLPEENDRAIAELVSALEGREPDGWTVEAMGDRYASMLPHIVAFRATVVRAQVKFKLGQDESATAFEEIVVALGDTPLSRMMRAARQP